jgi:threonine aldolase
MMAQSGTRRWDFRSDTVTKPTPGMRRAIFEAEVGDDVFEDDPTVQILERRVAEIVGKEASLFVPSGTMANQIALAVHTRPGDEVLTEAEGHVHLYEGGGPAVISGVSVKAIPGERGLITVDRFLSALRPSNVHYPPTTLLVLENTHNRAGGRVLPYDGFRETVHAARERGIKVHLDGARLWNAAVASGIPEAEWAAACDSVGVCLSKGLGAPVGSMICGSSEFVDRARFVRKRLGGGMRQVGILAAAGLYAVQHHRARLADDHRRARALASALQAIPEVDIDPGEIETNILRIGLRAGSPDRWCDAIGRHGVHVVPFGPGAVRAVTHLDIDDEGISAAIAAFESAAGSMRAG